MTRTDCDAVLERRETCELSRTTEWNISTPHLVASSAVPARSQRGGTFPRRERKKPCRSQQPLADRHICLPFESRSRGRRNASPLDRTV